MGIFAKMFGSENAITSIVKTAGGLIDELSYTDQERAEDQTRAKEKAKEQVISWMEATKGQNIARRYLALIITFVWLSQYMAAWIIDMAVVWITDADTVMRLNETVATITARAEGMNGAMMLILGFYFAAPHIGKIVDAGLGKFGKKSGDK